MTYFKKNLTALFALLLLITEVSIAQQFNIPVGSWRTHSGYRNLSNIAYDGSTIYASTSNLASNSNLSGLMSVNSDNEIEFFAKENGLSDFGIAQIGYSDNNRCLLITYANGNIDIIQNKETFNISDIKDKSLAGQKNAKNLNFVGSNCYITYDFGIVILDLNKKEIKETITAVNSSNSNIIFNTAVVYDTLFALSAEGLHYAKISDKINLLDVKNWKKIDNAPSDVINNSNKFKKIISYQNKLYICGFDAGVYYLQNNTWNMIGSLKDVGPLYNFTNSQGKLLVVSSYSIFKSDDGLNFGRLLTDFGELQNALYDNSGKLWVASSKGLLTLPSNSNQLVAVEYSTPYNNDAFKSYYNATLNELVVLAGGYDDGFTPRNNITGYNIFKDGIWKNYNVMNKAIKSVSNNTGQDTIVNRSVIDLVDVVFNPNNKTYYFASHGFGVSSLNTSNSSIAIYDTSNSSLENAYDAGQPGVRATALALEDNKLWVGQQKVRFISNALHSFVNNKWKAVKSTELSPKKIYIDSLGNKWMLNNYDVSNPIAVYNEKESNIVTYSYAYFSGTSGSTQVKAVYCFAMDRKNQLWVGTDKGIAIITETGNIFKSNTASATAYRPIFEGFPLLYTEQILSIKVDAANRKWIGTNNGTWLLNEDGSEVIARFTQENSPLPSNKITDIEIFGSTGEVFFTTDICLVSYRGTATESDKKTKKITVFPNPVLPSYQGFITIQGLPSNDCMVKITDEYGSMVYEMKSTGGSAVWNGINYSGNRIKSGVYLVFTSDKSGEQNFVSKFAVVQ